MELGWASAQASCSFPVRAPAISGRGFSASTRNPPRIASFVSAKPKGSAYLFDPVKLRCSCHGSVSDVTAVQNDSSEEQFPSCHDTPIENEERRSGEKMVEKVEVDGLCDKLIKVFMFEQPTPVEWRRLLAFSREWDNLRPHFYRRCQDRADSENDTEMKLKLLRLARKLKKVDEDVQRHNELIKLMKGAAADIDISEIVRKRRKDFTKEFFLHLDTVALSYKDKEEQQALGHLGLKFLAVVEAYDKSADSIEAINAAESKFLDLINSPTVEAACKKVGNLARKNQLDPALMTMITKAWSDAKESTMVKDEAKELLYKMYMEGINSLQNLIPKDIRILKYVLTIKDPEELVSVLKDAFTPGPELEGEHVDYLYTTPEALLSRIQSVLDAYYKSNPDGVVREAKDLLHPKIITKMENLKKVVQKHFL